MGTKNQRLWKEIGGLGQVRQGELLSSHFLNPVTNKKVHVFPDAPHLIKLFRNHVVDSGITFEDGVKLDKTIFLELLQKQTSELGLPAN